MSDSVRPHRWQPTRLPRPWDSPGKNTGVGCHFLLQCMKVKSESEVLEWGAIAFSVYQLSHKQSPRILEWVAYPFSSRSSQPRNWTGLSCIASRFFMNWAIREALKWGRHKSGLWRAWGCSQNCISQSIFLKILLLKIWSPWRCVRDAEV